MWFTRQRTGWGNWGQKRQRREGIGLGGLVDWSDWRRWVLGCGLGAPAEVEGQTLAGWEGLMVGIGQAWKVFDQDSGSWGLGLGAHTGCRVGRWVESRVWSPKVHSYHRQVLEYTSHLLPLVAGTGPGHALLHRYICALAASRERYVCILEVPGGWCLQWVSYSSIRLEINPISFSPQITLLPDHLLKKKNSPISQTHVLAIIFDASLVFFSPSLSLTRYHIL